MCGRAYPQCTHRGQLCGVGLFLPPLHWSLWPTQVIRIACKHFYWWDILESHSTADARISGMEFHTMLPSHCQLTAQSAGPDLLLSPMWWEDSGQPGGRCPVACVQWAMQADFHCCCPSVLINESWLPVVHPLMVELRCENQRWANFPRMNCMDYVHRGTEHQATLSTTENT